MKVNIENLVIGQEIYWNSFCISGGKPVKVYATVTGDHITLGCKTDMFYLSYREVLITKVIYPEECPTLNANQAQIMNDYFSPGRSAFVYEDEDLYID